MTLSSRLLVNCVLVLSCLVGATVVQAQSNDGANSDQPAANGQSDASSSQTSGQSGQTSAKQSAQQKKTAKLWANFNHYVLVARPDLASAAGKSLLKVKLPVLLNAVENGDYPKYRRNLDIAKQTDGVRQVAAKLEQRIQAARIAVSRQPERIEKDIALLPKGGRPYRNAVARLSAAGQFAAPQLLATLRDDDKKQLHPYVISAMTEIGKPMVAPLSVALPRLEPVTQQQVARVLAQIGYPLPPLPYLKQLLESSATDPDAKQAMQRAYQILSSKTHLSQGLSAARLFLTLGQSRYRQETRGERLTGYDASQNKGIVWTYGPDTGLVPVPVPGPIYGDVLAMRAARHSLQLDSNLSPSLSLWLTANLRRENRLPQGQQDPSYGRDMKPPSYYAMLAGPLRLQDVLANALNAQDAALALDAINALSRTAGTNALINRGAAQQPLLEALAFPDPRVRFHAAQALANARPTQSFTGAQRVVPVLAEAIRSGNVRYAMVIADSQQRVNQLLAKLGKQKFEAFGGQSLESLQGQISHRPAVDLIVADLGARQLRNLIRQTGDNYKLANAPILAAVSAVRQQTLAPQVREISRLSSTVNSGNGNGAGGAGGTGQSGNAGNTVNRANGGASHSGGTFSAAVKQAMTTMGKPVTGKQSTQYALTSLKLLHDIAASYNSVYHVADAEATLVKALGDNRDAVVRGAGRDLALIKDPTAQRALAKAALNGAGQLRVQLLQSLGDSATRFGNLLNQNQISQLLTLVSQSTGDTAIAAARAHGALTLPTSDAVKAIVQ